MTTLSVCLLPKLEGTGGPSIFQTNLCRGLEKHGISVHHNPDCTDINAILVIGGTNQLISLWRAKKRGVRIVQRLDGLHYLHRLLPLGIRHYLRAERNNLILAFIRRSLADFVVYQSNFVKDWWQTRYQHVNVRSQVIYNGVDLQAFTPLDAQSPPEKFVSILVIESSFRGGLDIGLQNSVEFALGLQTQIKNKLELKIIGPVSRDLITRINETGKEIIHWAGIIPHNNIPSNNRQAHMLFSADINAACPNTVIEALACGLPVIAYATGSLPELIKGDAGRIAPYGSDYWKLESPNPKALIQAALEILVDQPRFRTAARAHAERHFGLEKMTEQYLAALRI